MSLEQKLEENTVALNALAAALLAVNKAPAATVTKVAPEVKAAPAKAAPKPKVDVDSETEKLEAVIAEAEDDELTIKEIAAPKSVPVARLPKGNRDDVYFTKHLKPKLLQLVRSSEKGPERLRDILEPYGVTKASEVPSEHWDALFTSVEEALDL